MDQWIPKHIHIWNKNSNVKIDGITRAVYVDYGERDNGEGGIMKKKKEWYKYSSGHARTHSGVVDIQFLFELHMLHATLASRNSCYAKRNVFICVSRTNNDPNVWALTWLEMFFESQPFYTLVFAIFFYLAELTKFFLLMFVGTEI